MNEKYKDKFVEDKESSLREAVTKLAFDYPEFRADLLPVLREGAGNTDTFKCPECGSKVLENTKYCMKCQKKVKEAGVLGTRLGQTNSLTKDTLKFVIKDLEAGDVKGAKRMVKQQLDSLKYFHDNLEGLEGEDLADVVEGLKKTYKKAGQTKEAAHSLFKEIPNYRDLVKFQQEVKRIDEGSGQLLRDILHYFHARLTLTNNEEAAFNKLQNVAHRGITTPEMLGNNIFKIADLLKIKIRK